MTPRGEGVYKWLMLALMCGSSGGSEDQPLAMHDRSFRILCCHVPSCRVSYQERAVGCGHDSARNAVLCEGEAEWSHTDRNALENTGHAPQNWPLHVDGTHCSALRWLQLLLKVWLGRYPTILVWKGVWHRQPYRSAPPPPGRRHPGFPTA